MLLTRAIPLALAMLLLAACEMAQSAANQEFMRIPRPVRTGAAESAIERVEPDVSREEIFAAVQAQMSRETLCFSWPGLWLQESAIRNIYYVRYDLMARDWGAEVAASSRARMQEFVELGYLSRRERPDMGADVIEYGLTPQGAAYLHGSPYVGARPSFCAPAERRVVAITDVQHGQFACGSMQVRFTHVADAWPDWARTDNARARVAQTWTPLGQEGGGTVSMSRQWFRPGQIPNGVINGQLRSLCYDAADREIYGEDMELAGAP